MFRGPAWFALVQQRPAHVGVRERVFRLAGERRSHRRAGFVLAAESHQRDRPQVVALYVFGVELQAVIGRIQRGLPAITPGLDGGQQSKEVRVPRLQPDRLLNGLVCCGLPIATVLDHGERIVT